MEDCNRESKLSCKHLSISTLPPIPILSVSSQTLPCLLTGETICPTKICPNTPVNYTCTVSDAVGNTLWWNVPSVGGCAANTYITLAQAPRAPGQSCLTDFSSGTCGPFTATNTPPLTNNLYCLTSALSVVVTPAMDGLVVSCSSYNTETERNITFGNAIISVIGKPYFIVHCIMLGAVTSLSHHCHKCIFQKHNKS